MVTKQRECPTCGDTFANESGMKIHHSKSHGESITGHEVECDVCGDPCNKVPAMIKRDDNHYCSKPCRLQGQSRSKDEIINLIRNLHRELSRTPRKEDMDGEGCCRKTIRRKFGSWNEALEAAGFEINEVWKHENDDDRKIRYYGPNWDEQAAKARQRDSHQCVRCGFSNESSVAEKGRSLPVHHIEWDGSKDYEYRNRLSNLVTLCHSCHVKVESWPLSIQFQS